MKKLDSGKSCNMMKFNCDPNNMYSLKKTSLRGDGSEGKEGNWGKGRPLFSGRLASKEMLGSQKRPEVPWVKACLGHP